MKSRDLGFTHRFVPSVSGASPVTLLLLHGTGGNESDLLELGRALSPDRALLSPRGKVLENGMPRFFKRLSEGVFDVEDLQFRAHELADFVEAAAEEYGFPLSKVAAVGYSNGANIAAAVLLLRPSTLGAAVLFRPMVPLVPPSPPELPGKPILIQAGRFDPIVPTRETEELAEMLRKAGADLTLRWEEGHVLSPAGVSSARSWLSGVEGLLKTT